MCEAIKETQTRHCLLQQSIHQLAVFRHAKATGFVSIVIAMTLISNTEASEELNYTPTWPSRWSLQNHTRLISHDVERASYI